MISVLGPRGGSRNKPITQGMQNIIASMKKQNARRLVVTSTLSAKDPNDPLNFRTKAVVNLVKVTMHDAYKDIVSTARAGNEALDAKHKFTLFLRFSDPR